MSFRENISIKIKDKLKELYITQKDFALAVGVKQAAVSKWVLGAQVPDINLLPVVCEVLGISLNELFGYNENIDSHKAMKLYKAYLAHPDVRGSVDILLGIKKD